jgi:lipopolysaccharide/colanic/teichoic acid biosynthesis glycosyltransferase
VFFRQPRVGYGEEQFTCYKFRSMHVDAKREVHENHFKRLMQSNQPMVKLDKLGDARLIPFGAFLRSSGLDELPQLLNVVRGEMSLVGPRPCTPNEFADYLPWHKERFKALPGLTGLWQVKGKNDLNFEAMIQLDIRYARTQSLGLDLWIMLQTFPVLIREVSKLYRQRRDAKSAANGTAEVFRTVEPLQNVSPRTEAPGRAKTKAVDPRQGTADLFGHSI